MPYIDSRTRELIKKYPLARIESAGELNYLITQLIVRYMRENEPVRYWVINDIVGALEGAKLEFWRRVVTPYEMQKERENGDVY
jgi:hypothetical protein